MQLCVCVLTVLSERDFEGNVKGNDVAWVLKSQFEGWWLDGLAKNTTYILFC